MLTAKTTRCCALLLIITGSVALANETETQFNSAWQNAEQARQQAAQLGHEWRDTEKMLEQAKTLASAGDYEQALKLVAEAARESQNAIEQAKQQAKFWQDAVPK